MKEVNSTTNAGVVQQSLVSVRRLTTVERNLNTRNFFLLQERGLLLQLDKPQSAYQACVYEDADLAPQLWENAYRNVCHQYAQRNLLASAYLAPGTPMNDAEEKEETEHALLTLANRPTSSI